MKDYEALLQRIREFPYDHLGRKSVSEIYPYIVGYETALAVWSAPVLEYRLSREKYREWVEGKVHLCRQNLQSFCLLVAKDEEQAFDLYFELQDAALEECRADLRPTYKDLSFDKSVANKNGTLIDFLHDANFRRRPAMYFGNHRHTSGLWALCSGFLWAERDLGINDSSDAMNMEMFQLWLDERYPIAKGQTWDKLFDFEALHSKEGAINLFYENLEMFLAGEKHDTPPKWVQEAIKTIKKQMANEKGES